MFFVFVKSFFWTSKLLQLYWKIKNSVFSFSRRLKQISYSHFGYPAKQIRTIQIFTHTDTQTHWQISNHMSEGKLSQFEYRWENTVCLFFPSSVVNKSGRGGEIESNLLNYLQSKKDDDFIHKKTRLVNSHLYTKILKEKSVVFFKEFSFNFQLFYRHRKDLNKTIIILRLEDTF